MNLLPKRFFQVLLYHVKHGTIESPIMMELMFYLKTVIVINFKSIIIIKSLWQNEAIIEVWRNVPILISKHNNEIETLL